MFAYSSIILKHDLVHDLFQNLFNMEAALLG